MDDKPSVDKPNEMPNGELSTNSESNNITSSERLKIGKMTKHIVKVIKSTIKVKRRHSKTSKSSLASDKSNYLDSNDEEEMMHKYYRVKSEKVLKSLSKKRVKVKKRKTPPQGDGHAIQAETASIKSIDSNKKDDIKQEKTQMDPVSLSSKSSKFMYSIK